jgi:hypothetical protein
MASGGRWSTVGSGADVSEGGPAVGVGVAAVVAGPTRLPSPRQSERQPRRSTSSTGWRRSRAAQSVGSLPSVAVVGRCAAPAGGAPGRSGRVTSGSGGRAGTGAAASSGVGEVSEGARPGPLRGQSGGRVRAARVDVAPAGQVGTDAGHGRAAVDALADRGHPSNPPGCVGAVNRRRGRAHTPCPSSTAPRSVGGSGGADVGRTASIRQVSRCASSLKAWISRRPARPGPPARRRRSRREVSRRAP